MANVAGTTGSDTLNGTTGVDSIAGFGGGDTINSGNGNDVVYSGSGNDTVDGGSGADLIYGDSDLANQWGYRVYDRDFSDQPNQAPSITGGTLRGSGLTTGFDVNALANTARGTSGDPNDFGVVLTSTFTATTAGVYRFATTSDDGSTVTLLDANGVPLTFLNQDGSSASYMNNDFHQGATTRYGDVTLAAGESYTIEIRYWENLGGNTLAATVTPPGGALTNLNGSAFIGAPVNTNTGADSLTGGSGNDTIYGEAGNDTISGGTNNDQLNGGTGDDRILGDAGNDTLVGGAGLDTLIGGTGADALDGGAGQDTADYSASVAAVNVNLATGVGAGAGSDALGDTLAGVDGLIGSAFNDTLIGFDGQGFGADPYTNIFFGGAGNDQLDGAGGNDQLNGGDDNDTILGGTGNDSVAGDAGNDSLSGGDGLDTMFGGGSADVIAGDAGADVLDGGDGADTLSGGADNDTLTGGLGADSMVGGDGTDTFFVTAGDVVDGNESSGDNDTLNLNVAGQGKALTNIIYDPGNHENGTVQFLDGAGVVIGSMTFTNIENVIPCFTPGTLIETDRGEIAVERLIAGDRVMTRDHGYQPLRWVGRRDLSAVDLAAQDNLHPVLIRAGALGCNMPTQDMLVSPQHRMLFCGPHAEMMFGEPEVLIAAIHLIGRADIFRAHPTTVSYIHVMCADHEIIRANGCWTESYQPGAMTLQSLQQDQRDELLALFPALAGENPHYPAARLSLKAHEARVLLAA